VSTRAPPRLGSSTNDVSRFGTADVSERLGHSSISITLDTYSHVIPTLQETAAELVAAMVLTSPHLKPGDVE
jgi:integrase